MDLLEHHGKEILRAYGIRLPRGVVVHSPRDVEGIEALGLPVVLKAQVPVGGRGRAGGVMFARSRAEIMDSMKHLFGAIFYGHKVEAVLVEERVEVREEYYVAITMDMEERSPVVMLSPLGGTEVEEKAVREIYRVVIDPLIGPMPYQFRAMARHIGGADMRAIVGVLKALYDIFIALECELVEVNPLALSKDGALVALDAKIRLDPEGLWRHKDELSRLSIKWQDAIDAPKGVNIITMDGAIGIIANGAGLAMATLDAVVDAGGRVGVVCDLSGTADMDVVRGAIESVINTGIKAVFINVFGGITKADMVAKAIARSAFKDWAGEVVARISGSYDTDPRVILQPTKVHLVATIKEGAMLVTDLAGRGAD